MFPVLYFILFLWSITSLLYALIKRDERAIEAFVIMTPLFYISVGDYVFCSNHLAFLPFIVSIYSR